MHHLVKSAAYLFIVVLTFLSGCKTADTSAIIEEAPESGVSVKVVTSEEGEKPFKATTTEIIVNSVVTAIDLQTREVVLLGDDGVEQSIIASEDARNLDQISIGDKVTIKYLENFTIKVVDGENIIPTTSSASGTIRSEKGEMPAGGVGTKKIEVFIVEEINLNANTFKLRNAKGAIKEFNSKDPQRLKDSSVGDAVILNTSNSVAIEVRKVTGE